MTRTDNKIVLEVCVDSVESAMAAEKGGADRVELCDNLVEGGTTPSSGAIALAREKLSLGLHVIIRPRGGDFLYSGVEFEVMKRDIGVAKQNGADGVVIGILSPDGTIDRARTSELTRLARPMSVTFHRAFDMTRDPFEALETLIEIGVDRILTSGQEATAERGAKLIGELVERASGRITIMACGEIREANVRSIIRKTGVREIHATGFVACESGMTFRNPRVYMGGEDLDAEYTRKVTDAATIAALRGAAEE
ncbi:MAG: copper homeostasis protein CutC [Acidobacteria bacterium OLB17]|nr:MAG: copper homeostasis protein CutC [Acidobacteria bacterium OLB17]MCZ2391875.1 copper homeostasis protein CutC [Acidobacteriota bacterium]